MAKAVRFAFKACLYRARAAASAPLLARRADRRLRRRADGGPQRLHHHERRQGVHDVVHVRTARLHHDHVMSRGRECRGALDADARQWKLRRPDRGRMPGALALRGCTVSAGTQESLCIALTRARSCSAVTPRQRPCGGARAAKRLHARRTGHDPAPRRTADARQLVLPSRQQLGTLLPAERRPRLVNRDWLREWRIFLQQPGSCDDVRCARSTLLPMRARRARRVIERGAVKGGLCCRYIDVATLDVSYGSLTHSVQYSTEVNS